ncbi:MAG: DJ-1/PfpI family protein [Acidimicrobiia bacterium]
MTTSIAIFVFDGVEELDFVGPWEVLRVWERVAPEESAVRVFTVAAAQGTIECAKGLRVVPDETWASAPPIDVLVYPGGIGTRAHIGDEAHRSWVRDVATHGALMTSVCTGSLVYADAGLLDGRPATTHWASLEDLASLGKDIEVRPDDRYVDSGGIITASGVSAGIDMALHLVRRLDAEERARWIRRYIQYDPQPPV